MRRFGTAAISAARSGVILGLGRYDWHWAFGNQFRSEGCESRRERHDKGRSFLRLRVPDKGIQAG